MDLIIKKSVEIFLICVFIITISSSLSFSQIKINNIQNNIYVLDVHGKRYTLDNYKTIKSGDYLKTRKNPAILIFDNKTKICFSAYSSLKIKHLKISKGRLVINLIFKKGNILLSVPNNSKDKHNVGFSNYKITNFKDEIIISEQNKFEILNFNNKLTLVFKNKKNFNIPPYYYAKISKKENLLEIDKTADVSIYTNKFLKGCVSQIENLKEKKRGWDLQYGCVTQNGRLVCGNRYK